MTFTNSEKMNNNQNNNYSGQAPQVQNGAMPIIGNEEQNFMQRDKLFTDLFDRYKTTVAKSLPSGYTATSFMQIAINQIHKTPKLLECNQISLLMSMIEIAQLGLSVDSNLGECYLIPYKDKCSVIIGYKGLLKLAYRSGRVKTVQSHVVYSFDKFDLELGLTKKIKHIPMFTSPRTIDKIIGFYSIVELTNGGVLWEFMFIDEVLKIRDESNNYKYARNKEETIWTKHFVEQGKKTALRKVLKITPLETDIDRAVTFDMQQDHDELAMQNRFIDIVSDDEKEVLQHEINEYKEEEKRMFIEENKQITDAKVIDALDQLDVIVQRKQQVNQDKSFYNEQ